MWRRKRLPRLSREALLDMWVMFEGMGNGFVHLASLGIYHVGHDDTTGSEPVGRLGCIHGMGSHIVNTIS